MRPIIFSFLFVLHCQPATERTRVPAPTETPSIPSVPPIPSNSAPWDVHFSPHGGCTQEVATFIRQAKTNVHLQAYGFTSSEVADALCDVAHAGKSVEIVLDRSNLTDKHSMMQKVFLCGAHVSVDSHHPIAHNKVVIVDSSSVETGSFNFTQAAENNAENCLIIHSPDLAVQYLSNFHLHQSHSIPQFFQ